MSDPTDEEHMDEVMEHGCDAALQRIHLLLARCTETSLMVAGLLDDLAKDCDEAQRDVAFLHKVLKERDDNGRTD